MKESYRLDEVAEKLDVSRRTVERAIKDGDIQSFKLRGSRRIEADELERVKKERDQ